MRQALNYGANQGVEWVVLTNSIEWRLYRIKFGQPIDFEEVSSFNFLNVTVKNEKVHFDLVMTMIADTLYWRLAQNLRGFKSCDAPKIFRSFMRGQGIVDVRNGQLTVTYPKRAHNPRWK